MKKRIFTAILALCMVFALAACGEETTEETSPSPEATEEAENTAEPEASPETSDEPEAAGNLSADVTFETSVSTVEEEGVTYMTAESLVPTVVIEGSETGEEAAAAIEQTLTERLTVAQETIDEYAGMAREQYAELGDATMETWGGYSQIYSAEMTRGDGVLSVHCTVSSYTGGAHGNTEEFGLTFDLSTGELLTVEDIAEDLEGLKSHVAESVTAQAAEMDEGTITGDIDAFAEGVLDTEQWYLNEEGLVVFASPYEIAAYAVGTISFTIPYSELEGLLNSSLLPA